MNRLLKRKLATLLLVGASVVAFATLGDGGKKDNRFLSPGASKGYKSFTLKSSYNYRGDNILNSRPGKFIMVNTVMTVHKGNATYIIPLKKKVLLDKIKFNPAPNRF